MNASSKTILALVLIAAFLISCSCTQRVLDFTIVSSKQMELRAALEQEGKDVKMAMQGVLYHSSVGVSNDETIKTIGIQEVKEAVDAEAPAAGNSTGR